MEIEKIYGLNATEFTMNDRFTTLSGETVHRPHFRNSGQSYPNESMHLRKIAQLKRLVWRLDRKCKILQLRFRLGMRQNRAQSVQGMHRGNSFGNLSQANWKGSSNNLSRSASFSNLSQFNGQSYNNFNGYKKRGGGNWTLRGISYVPKNRQGRILRNMNGGNNQIRGTRMRGMARGMQRNQTQKPVPSKEELDVQLDQYMASSKSVLDKQLDEYMQEDDVESTL